MRFGGGPARGLTSKRAHMYPAKLSVGATTHPARMSLSAEQHSLIAAAYDSAVLDVSAPLTRERPSLEKQIGFGCLPALEKRKSERHSRNRKPRNHRPTRFGFGACKATATRVGKALFTGRASSARAKP